MRTLDNGKPPRLHDIARALFIVNRNAKTAIHAKELYSLKHKTVQKLLEENKAKKIGLHFSKNPKNAQQHSNLLIQVDNYYFHVPPRKKDFSEVPHLGEGDASYRNPKTSMPLYEAKRLLEQYTGYRFQAKSKPTYPKRQAPVFTKLGEPYPWHHPKR
ncbi:hypothetical protein G4V62_05425 [Bacillaceae bacterium SIJ1]|uniref:YkyB family protein n=1 Tax=Litoribacterium kuwaitense TaxID=1398745 RepID=UPI0013E9A2F0|nr:YkyB family protein [Litoribacterium kuwaitense]NGP44421.1 hypothetical protein [Litoribacterium kuwaitense]